MAKDGNFHVSINFGISSAFILIIVVTSVLLSTLSFLTIRDAMRSDLARRMHDVVTVGRLAVDAKELDAIRDPEAANSPEYADIFKTLTYLRENVTDVGNVYTMRINEKGEYVFVVDADPDEKSRAAVNEAYPDATAEMKAVFEKRDAVYVEKQFSTDEWGTWLSGYAPLFTSEGKFTGILGIDISAKTILDNELRVLLVLLGITGGVIVAGILLGVFLSKRITSPLSLLEKDIERIQRFLFDDTLDLKTIFRELKSIDNTVDNVKASLRSFQKYVPADLVRQLIAMKKEAVLGGDKKVLTIFFSDIKDSTTIAESMKPEVLIKFLDKYFEGMTGSLLKHKATIDKFIGDSVMAFWNAPLDDPNHAYNACAGALATKEFLKGYNVELEKKGIMQLITRVGINTGEVIVGNIGYENRFNYTVMGDPVNLASRLEALNKYYGTGILISESTYAGVKDKVVARNVDRVVVKGKTKGIPIYELLSLKSGAPQGFIDLAVWFNKAMDSYYRMEFKETITFMDKILKDKPDDVPAKMIKDRCAEFLKNPPPAGWDGVFVQGSK